MDKLPFYVDGRIGDHHSCAQVSDDVHDNASAKQCSPRANTNKIESVSLLNPLFNNLNRRFNIIK